MDYYALMQDAWSLTWRHRFLWVLALFAGGSATCTLPANLGQSTNTGDLEDAIRESGGEVPDLGEWLGDHITLMLTIVAVLLLTFLVLSVVSLIAQGEMARATVDLARGHGSSPGRSWRAGLQYFWRYLRLWLLLAAVWLVPLAVVAVLVVGLVTAGLVTRGAGGAVFFGLGLLFGGLGLLAFFLHSVPFTIVTAYAQRALVLEDAGAVNAVRVGVRLLRARLGASLLLWLVTLALGVVAGIAVFVGVFIVFIVLLIVGAIVSFATGPAGIVTFLVVAALGVLATPMLAYAVMNTFMWNYWTLAYLTLTGRRERAG